MKKNLNVLFCAFIFVWTSSVAYSYCSTGFACSIKDMEKLEQESRDNFVSSMNDYFNKNKKEDIFFGKISSEINYNDLFWFNTII